MIKNSPGIIPRAVFRLIFRSTLLVVGLNNHTSLLTEPIPATRSRRFSGTGIFNKIGIGYVAVHPFSAGILVRSATSRSAATR